MSHRSLQNSVANATIAAGEAAMDSAVTIAARLPIFAGFMMAPTPGALAEINRACSEKVKAGFEGALAACTAFQKVMLQSVFTMPTATSLAADMVTVMSTAANPAHKRVKANAARLVKSTRG